MLTMFIRGHEALSGSERICTNVETEFAKISLGYNEVVEKLLHEIEGGVYSSQTTFVDRYGVTLYTDFLSTGCKAALVVLFKPEICIDLKECGYNARDAIIRHVRNGKILISYPHVSFSFDDNDESSTSIDVLVDKYRFTDIRRLNEYFADEWPDPPDLDTDGVRLLLEECNTHYFK